MGMRTRFRPALPVMALLVSALVAFPAPALAGGHRVIRVTTTIQAAVDAAMPGDTVVVPPGTYRESVLIDKSDLTVRGSRGAIIDAQGFTNGIRVGSGEETPGPAASRWRTPATWWSAPTMRAASPHSSPAPDEVQLIRIRRPNGWANR